MADSDDGKRREMGAFAETSLTANGLAIIAQDRRVADAYFQKVAGALDALGQR